MAKSNIVHSFFFVILISVISLSSFAQEPKKPVIVSIPKFKPPITKTYLGKYFGTTATISAAEGKQLITTLLKITDDKNNAYKISSYQFAYVRKGFTEDEATGKVSPQSDMVADRFSATPLPAIWQTNIEETLHTGEQLYFFDVIVLDKEGRLFFSTELKITIE